MKLYIAGPMRGMPDLNQEAFFSAEDRLNAMGFETVNPARINPPTATYEQALECDMAAIQDCGGIVLLPGWENSQGVQEEIRLGTALGLTFFSPDMHTMDMEDMKIKPNYIIGIVGLKGCGKSLVAGFLQSQYEFARLSFATPIKRMCEVIAPPNYLYGDKKEEVIPWLGVTGRHIMQTLGTDWGRKMVSDTIWTAALVNSEAFLKMPRIVVDDVRFLNEAAALREKGGKIWRVTRPGLLPDGHASEQEGLAIKADMEIINNGSVEQLQRKILTLL